MIFKKLEAKIRDTIRISDSMSLCYMKIADDLRPVWREILPVEETIQAAEGDYLSVTPDMWFVFEKGKWRIMSLHEHLKAARQPFFIFSL